MFRFHEQKAGSIRKIPVEDKISYNFKRNNTMAQFVTSYFELSACHYY